ncbi:hypothetical protein [Paenibacillus sp. Soil724D2]|uniref:hypothetical protein n=1 Tax=Paenibacillus sp. (strain Soil724D2) TaxID=1736392 RepID=UPI000714AB10|nr:hypothetical protein [Paenibacillus sp. Soil724D2]KRE52228.1 hypothetical protein ASG85_03630 [Paenibacillus sp. Soil724D2]
MKKSKCRYKEEFKISLIHLFPLFVLCAFISPEKRLMSMEEIQPGPTYVAGTVMQVKTNESETVLLISVPDNLEVPSDLLHHSELLDENNPIHLSDPVISPRNRGKEVEILFQSKMKKGLNDFLGVPAVGEIVQSLAEPDAQGAYHAQFLLNANGDYIVATN